METMNRRDAHHSMTYACLSKYTARRCSIILYILRDAKNRNA